MTFVSSAFYKQWFTPVFKIIKQDLIEKTYKKTGGKMHKKKKYIYK